MKNLFRFGPNGPYRQRGHLNDPSDMYVPAKIMEKMTSISFPSADWWLDEDQRRFVSVIQSISNNNFLEAAAVAAQ